MATLPPKHQIKVTFGGTFDTHEHALRKRIEDLLHLLYRSVLVAINSWNHSVITVEEIAYDHERGEEGEFCIVRAWVAGHGATRCWNRSTAYLPRQLVENAFFANTLDEVVRDGLGRFWNTAIAITAVGEPQLQMHGVASAMDNWKRRRRVS